GFRQAMAAASAGGAARHRPWPPGPRGLAGGCRSRGRDGCGEHDEMTLFIAVLPSRAVAQPAAPLTGERARAAKVTTPRMGSGGMSRGVRVHGPRMIAVRMRTRRVGVSRRPTRATSVTGKGLAHEGECCCNRTSAAFSGVLDDLRGTLRICARGG